MKILLLGKNGQVGWELQRALCPLGELIALGSADADLRDEQALRACVREHRPGIVVNAAAYTAVDKAESEADVAHAINALAPGVLAEEASRIGAWLVHYSTDYVFDGSRPGPYSEQDPTNPLSVYGRTKLEGERLIAARHARPLILRTSWVFAARGGNFAKTMLRLAQEREQLNVVADQIGAPTSAELIADVTALALQRIQLAQAPEALAGIYHLTAGGSTSWHGYAQHVLGLAERHGIALKVKPEQVLPIPSEAYPVPAPRPKNSRLNTSKLQQAFAIHLPDWRFHVERMMEELTGPTARGQA